jgi:hypothetical protein
VAERFTDASVHKTVVVDLALITSDDELRKDLARSILKTARHHDPHTLSLLHTVPGIGKILRGCCKIPQVSRLSNRRIILIWIIAALLTVNRS